MNQREGRTAYHSSSQSFRGPISPLPTSRPQSFARRAATLSKTQSDHMTNTHHAISSNTEQSFLRCLFKEENPKPPPPPNKVKMVTYVWLKTLTKCAGLSTVRCARNSALTYSSPSNRISFGKWRLWARRRRLYSGMGGSNAMGSGRRPPPLRVADVAVASRRG